MNKQQIKDALKDAKEIEVYKYTDSAHRIHTDFIESVEMDADALPYDDNGEIDADVILMDEEEYSRTILANSCVSTKDFWEGDDKIGIIVLK